MKGLWVLLFTSLTFYQAYAQIPAEVDYQSRYDEYEQASLRLDEQEQIVRQVEAEAQAVDQDFALVTDKIQRKRGRRKLNKARIAEIKTIVPNLTQKIASLGKEERELTQVLAALKIKVAKLQKIVQDKKAKVDELAPGVAAIEEKVKSIEKKINNKVSLKKSKTASVNDKTKQLNDNKTKISSLTVANQKLAINKKDLEQKIAGLADGSRELPILKKRLAKVTSQIEANKKTIASKTAENANLKTQIATLKKEVEGLDLAIAKLKKEKGAVISGAGSLYTQYEAAKKALKEAKLKKNQVSDKAQATGNTLKEISAKLIKSKNRLGGLRVEREELKAMQIKLKGQIVRLSQRAAILGQDSDALWARFDSESHLASRIRGQVDTFFSIYEETKARFDSYMNAAIVSGKNQGMALGENEGRLVGAELGAQNGAQEAKELGKELGKLQGFLAGLKDGYQNGKTKGYNDGFNLPNNYQTGYNLGFKAGKEQAYQDAEAEDYPQGRLDKQKELLARPLSGSSLYEAGKKTTVEVVAGDYGYYYKPKSTNTGSGVNSDAILLLIDSISQKIEALEKQILSLKENPASGVDINVPNRLNELKCPDQYPANYSEFINACTDSFTQSFKSEYQAAFTEEYNALYLQDFEKTVEEQLSTFGNTRTKEGYQKAYAPTYNKFKLIGARDAQNKGYNDGHKKAYKQNIKEARKLAYSRGQADEKEFFDTHSVIKLLKASLVSKETKFIPGANIDLGIEVGNYGGVATNSGEVQVNVQTISRGLEVKTPSAEVSAMNGLSKISQSAIISLVVGEDVQPGEDLKLKVNITSKGKLVDSKIVSVKADADYQASLAIEGSARPSSRRNTIAVNITNLSRTKLTSGLTLKMSSSSRYIKLKNGSMRDLGAMSKGEVKKVSFTYVRKRKARRKKIILSYDLMYQGKVIKTEKFEIIPR